MTPKAAAIFAAVEAERDLTDERIAEWFASLPEPSTHSDYLASVRPAPWPVVALRALLWVGVPVAWWWAVVAVVAWLADTS